MNYIRPALLSACAALALVPLMARAQSASAPVPAIVDPAARALIMQMAAAQQALHSFVLTVDTQNQVGASARPRPQTHSQIAYSAPARAAVTLSQHGKTLVQFFSDGTASTTVDIQHKSYRQDALPAGEAARIVAAGIGSPGLLPGFYADPGGLLNLLSAPGVVAVARGPEMEPMGGVPVESVVTRTVGSNAAEGTFTFVIGQSDHLLRQVIVHETAPAGKSGPARDLTHTETVTALEANPSLPAALFAYKPGRGFKKIGAAQ